MSISEGVVVTLPVPPIGLSKNGRLHWAEKNGLYQQHKMVARAALNALPMEPWRGKVWVRVQWGGRGRLPDHDNAVERLAAYVDAAQDVGMFVNDSQVSGYRIVPKEKRDGTVVMEFMHEAETRVV